MSESKPLSRNDPMRTVSLLKLTLTAASVTVSAAETMHISLCNQANASEKMLHGSKAEVEIAYQAAGIDIRWVACENAGSAKELYGDRYFVVRLRNGTDMANPRGVSLDTMGRAYTERRGSGYLADVYLPSIARFAARQDIDFQSLVGLVISHELGHLLLGPGHSQRGIMFSHWTKHETEAGRKRGLRFNKDEAVTLVQQLRERAAAVR